MPYIYQITNLLNGKIYIGKTLHSIEKRWKEHCNDAYRERNINRPLYAAIRKYGPENFKIETLEEVDEQHLNEREVYWIEILGSFKNGYNATLGGDGKSYLDYDAIYSLYQEGLTIKDIAKTVGCSTDSVRGVLDRRQISQEERKKRGWESIQHQVAMLDKDTEEILKVFPSVTAAQVFLDKGSGGHIGAVCRGKRKTAYGYKWKYI